MAAKKTTTATKPTPKKQEAEEQKALATIKDSALISAADIEGDAGGHEFSREDIAIPRLSILQALSPQVTKGKPEFIPGATAGEIIDSVSGDRWDGEEGITIIPVSYRRAYIEWTPRSEGGGFVADHGSDATVLSRTTKGDKGQDLTPEGNEIVTTAEYFVLLVDEDGNSVPMMLSMAKTQLKKARRWNTLIQQLQVPRANGAGTFNPAMFFRSYKLTTVPESNDQGSWFSWSITPDEFTLQRENGEQLYLNARALREAVLSGAVKAAPVQQDADAVDADPDAM